MSIEEKQFGYMDDGRPVSLFRLKNRNGLEALIMTMGGILLSLKVPDGHGKLDDIVLGFDSLDEYKKGHPYFGALIGRYANRIAEGKISIEGVDYQLTRNDGDHHLHGGFIGFDKVLWQAQASEDDQGAHLLLSHVSPDGDQGYPGTLTVRVRYTLNDANELRLDYEAETDQTTIVNLTHHSYFNLAGKGDVLQHRLHLNAAYYLPTDAHLIPTGELELVNGTPMDFRLPKSIGRDIGANYAALHHGGGYDHNWVLIQADVLADNGLTLAAEVLEPLSGRRMKLYTTQPGSQFYSGNFLDGRLRGKGGISYQRHSGFCLEPQHFPDSPHHSAFPGVVVRPGEIYRQSSVYCFSGSTCT